MTLGPLPWRRSAPLPFSLSFSACVCTLRSIASFIPVPLDDAFFACFFVVLLSPTLYPQWSLSFFVVVASFCFRSLCFRRAVLVFFFLFFFYSVSGTERCRNKQEPAYRSGCLNYGNLIFFLPFFVLLFLGVRRGEGAGVSLMRRSIGHSDTLPRAATVVLLPWETTE